MTEFGVDLRALGAQSEWLGARDGLIDAVERWYREVPPLRDKAERRGARLARPRATTESVAAAARTGGRFAALMMLAARDWTFAFLRVRPPVVAGEPASPLVRHAERLVRAGGPAYVKFGQFIASARGLASDEVVSAFQWCCDEVAPMEPGRAERIIESDLGKPVTQLFASFDPAPLAAASVAQVHAATLHDGTEVVVKVRRPHLASRFANDIRAMALFAWAGSRITKRARAANLPGIIDLFSRLCMQELDLRIEALNMVEVGLAIEDAGHTFMRSPRPMPDMVTRHVLVMERVPGVRYNEALEHFPDLDGHALLHVGISNVVEHALIYGVFHGDLHAGNVFVDEKGVFWLIDFGIVARVAPKDRPALMRFNVASANKDTMMQLQAMQQLGAIPFDADLDVLVPIFDEQQARLDALMNVNRDEIDFKAVSDESSRMTKMLLTHGFQLPIALVLFSKNMLYLNALADAVAPGANVLEEIDRAAFSFMAKHPEAIASLLQSEA